MVAVAENSSEKERGGESGSTSVLSKLNWLRAGVLGANDGLTSTAGLVIGVAASGAHTPAIVIAGLSGLVSGAASMALGEYVSVSSQRDTERALVRKESTALHSASEAESAELIGLLQDRGLSEDTAMPVNEELSGKNLLRAHLSLELGIDAEQLVNPLHAAISSAVSFSLGAALPIMASLVSWNRIGVIVAVTMLGLAIAGYISAYLGGAGRKQAMIRIVVGGFLALAVSYVVGRLLGTAALAL